MYEHFLCASYINLLIHLPEVYDLGYLSLHNWFFFFFFLMIDFIDKFFNVHAKLTFTMR